MSFQWKEARALIKDQQPYSLYIIGLSHGHELLLNEDESLLDTYASAFDKHLEVLDGLKPISAELLFAQAELNLLWAFVNLKFGQEFEAALHMRSAYKLAAECREKYPAYLPILKSHGLLQILMGTVPEKYNWILRIMGMEGNTQVGLEEMQRLSQSNDVFAQEASLLLALLHSYIWQDPVKANNYIEPIFNADPQQPMTLFIKASLALKSHDANTSIQMLQAIGSPKITAAQYQMAEALLYKGDYAKAIDYFQTYSKEFKGNSFIKDAHFKTGLCYQLMGDSEKAQQYYQKARSFTHENTEADRYAGRVLNAEEGLNTQLTRIRFFTDGGFYEQAKAVVKEVSPKDIPSLKEQVEFYYRQARLAHLSGQSNAARLFYEQTIDMSEKQAWYYAPNACLQLGYLKIAANDKTMAREYFTKALSYKKHEYKNSIDAKAKAALHQLSERK